MNFAVVVDSKSHAILNLFILLNRSERNGCVTPMIIK